MPQASKIVRRLAFWSIPLAFGVMGLKFVAWHVTGSIALYSDALESIVNVIAALAAFFAIGYAQKPADTGHPYGHHKAEYFSAVLEGVLIVVAALLIVNEAVGGLLEPKRIEAPGLGLAINGSAAIINAIWAMVLLRFGRRYRSPALQADGNHILSDVVTSVGVIAGLGLALAFDQPRLDPLLALIVACNVLWQGWKVIASSVDGLMDRAIDPADESRIQDIIRAEANGAIEAHDIRTRMAGRVSFVEFHLVVDGRMSVEESHRICDRLETALKQAVDGVQVIIHVEPGHKAKDEGVVLG
ncbi:MAG: cation diffusion facilitator family transporter [Hoeflea sp.]|uniref:cation diffusion facilitator family transporter n=1 Tax=Hoeflea sp. TaxID=1940281 RepID=UPI001D9FF551|nr:cation diffusion facilitator family transporter [Hoeflea sp.]MBU4527288.1 cation diffusion facilitator family transporter [Alphaproteobacteria bacterium]MBU4546929.1 cation diffusion facilitator family transporter [Alphaproteobacteria bacterium]MBU4551559.1 cation diffusion facilitator family transporter [Alphaproteobacteria bacterium]MBV1725564.1 cation diffusion facilitator family transporter [Hoeflea sp.]MBV1759612.1 cation diffusion facilitator family transporter [Hoeflea sp.]